MLIFRNSVLMYLEAKRHVVFNIQMVQLKKKKENTHTNRKRMRKTESKCGKMFMLGQFR